MLVIISQDSLRDPWTSRLRVALNSYLILLLCLAYREVTTCPQNVLKNLCILSVVDNGDVPCTKARDSN